MTIIHLRPTRSRPTQSEPTMPLSVRDTRAEVLFATDIQPSERRSPAQVRAAIQGWVRAHGGAKAAAAIVAGEFGDHPDTALLRMCWCREQVAAAFARRAACVCDEVPLAVAA